MTTPIRIGIVGLGWVSTHRHIPALLKSHRFRLIGVADRNAELAQAWARKLGVKAATATSIDDIKWLDEVDAIDVATSPMSHYDLISSSLRRGKHVITEKPFAMDVAQGEELVALAKELRLRLCIVHNFQYASAANRLARDLDNGRIGRIRAITAMQWGNPARRLPSWYEQLPAGLFYDESPHLLYLIRRFSPAPLRLHSVDICKSTTGNATPASVDVSYRSETSYGEVPVSVNCRFEAPLSEWHVAVLGDRAAGILDVFRNIYIHLPNDGMHEAPQVLRTSASATVAHWLQHLTNGPLHLTGRLLYGNETVFRKFAEAIQSESDADDVSGKDALDVLKMQWDILKAQQTGTHP